VERHWSRFRANTRLQPHFLLVLIGPFIAEPFSAETYSEHDIRSPLYERTEKWSGKDRELFTGQTNALIQPAGKIFHDVVKCLPVAVFLELLLHHGLVIVTFGDRHSTGLEVY
jgi:hypothetical protein